MKAIATLLLMLFVGTTIAQANVKPKSETTRSVTKDTIKARFDVRPGGTLYLEVDHGSIEVETSGDDEVYVELERAVKGATEAEEKEILEHHEYDISQDGNNIYVESRFDDEEDSSWSWRRLRKNKKFKLSVTIRVPERFNVDFENGAGNVEIEDEITGSITGRTGAGNIIISDVNNGPVDVSSGAGNIEIGSVGGWVEVRSGAGNITIEEVAGRIDAQTGAGNVVATLTRQPEDDSDLGSGAGNVTVYLASTIAVDVEARSSLGSASCEFGLDVKGKWMSKSFGGELNGGGPSLTLHSGVGNVSLRKY